jgi:imidazolonepropionase-like amidohydrolase
MQPSTPFVLTRGRALAGSLALCLAVVLGLVGEAQPTRPGQGATAFVGAHLIPISSAPIEDGVLIVRGGKIEAIGARGELAIPDGATIVDLAGQVLMPGLVCTHSHVGAPYAADGSGPLQPEVSSVDSVNVHSPTVHRARAGGLTTINAMPGSGHLMGGQTAYLKLRLGNTVDDLVYRFADGAPMGGLKMANGTNPQRSSPFPGTRAKSAALVREKFLAAQSYLAKKRAAAEDDEKEAPDVDLGLEALCEVLEGKRIVHHHTHRHDDIMTVIRLSQEFGFRVVLHHVSEGWKVADEIAAAGIASSVILVDSPGGKLEARDLSFDTCRMLYEAGAPIAIHTDDYITDSRLFLRSAALAVRAGLPREAALAAVTLAGAKMLDLGDRIGSLEVGKDADLCVLDGDPLSVYSLVTRTYVEGELVFDLSNPDDRIYAVGGPGAGEERVFSACCAVMDGFGGGDQ